MLHQSGIATTHSLWHSRRDRIIQRHIYLPTGISTVCRSSMADSYIRGAIFTDIPTSGERPVLARGQWHAAHRTAHLPAYTPSEHLTGKSYPKDHGYPRHAQGVFSRSAQVTWTMLHRHIYPRISTESNQRRREPRPIEEHLSIGRVNGYTIMGRAQLLDGVCSRTSWTARYLHMDRQDHWHTNPRPSR